MLKCGLVGLPNVGKSTLFNVLTGMGVPAENYPFCTIDPHTALVAVPDERLEALAAIVHPKETIPTLVEFVDIAGLVAGASQGEGLGNQFLAAIREVDLVAQVVRCFGDSRIIHVAGKVDPVADLETIETELLLADLQSASRRLEKASRMAKSGKKEHLEEARLLEEASALLEAGKSLREFGFAGTPGFLTAKPMVVVANVGEEEKEGLSSLGAYCEKRGLPLAAISARLEKELLELAPEERKAFLEEAGYEEGGLERLVRLAYGVLGRISFFTAGPKEVRAWQVQKGATAPQAAGVIHTDFERGFIRAEVVSFEDFIACRGWEKARSAGKLRLEGKDYIMADGDIVHFRFHV